MKHVVASSVAWPGGGLGGGAARGLGGGGRRLAAAAAAPSFAALALALAAAVLVVASRRSFQGVSLVEDALELGVEPLAQVRERGGADACFVGWLGEGGGSWRDR